ncbi:MAG: NAD-dependent epimerase/dehydratase family protein [Planctomycetota bacterium]|nr:NAD-dependent epimerase/dehydratase family protein [Planctomycetota bacterium]
MPKLLILGGSGFVSGTLAREALASGWTVTILTRGQRPLPAGVQSLVADRHDAAAFEKAFASAGAWDLVVDCIGFQVADVRQDLATFARRAARLVFISTDFVFDPARRRFPQPEETQHFVSAGYGGGKRACELELLAAGTGGLPWTVVRPCHIYGPGSLLGCLPQHGRDPKLLDKLRAGETLKLVGGGHFLQQPIFAPDLARLVLSLATIDRANGQILNAAGPDIVESRRYYQIIADVLGVPLKVEEVPVQAHLAANPDSASFLCHRIYDLSRLRALNAATPATPIEVGLKRHVESLL